jgi:hypothetical protein
MHGVDRCMLAKPGSEAGAAAAAITGEHCSEKPWLVMRLATATWHNV